MSARKRFTNNAVINFKALSQSHEAIWDSEFHLSEDVKDCILCWEVSYTFLMHVQLVLPKLPGENCPVWQ